MPKWKNATAKQATRMVGSTATPLNRNTSRTCSRDPADPRRRSTHTRVKRAPSTAPSISNTDRLARIRPKPTLGFQPSGDPRARMMNVASPTISASAFSASVTPFPSRISANWPPRYNLGSEMMSFGVCGAGVTLGARTFISSAMGDPTRSLHQPAHDRDFQIAYLLPQRVAVQPQHRRCLDLVATRCGQGQADQRPFHLRDDLVVHVGHTQPI